MTIQELQEKRLSEIGDDPIKKALNMHREKLSRVSEITLSKMEELLPESTIDQASKAYETARRNLNTIDGRADSTQQLIAVLPGELAIKFSYDTEIQAQLQRNKDTKKPIEAECKVFEETEDLLDKK